MSVKSKARISTRTSGRRALKRAMSGARMPPGAGPSVPMTSERPWPRTSPRARSSAASARESSCWASGSSASPAGVSSTRRVERTNNGPPISRSS